MIYEYKGPRLPRLKQSYEGGSITSYEKTIYPDSQNQIDSIKSSIQNIIKTRVGERVMSNFGSNIDFAAFEKADSDLAVFGSTMIRDSISAYEPRVQIENIVPRIDGDTVIWDVQLRCLDNFEVINISVKNK